MRKISVLILALCIIIPQAAFAQKVIRWDEAGNYYGKNVTVIGKVVGSYNSGKACFLNFHEDYKKSFTAVIFASDFDRFPSDPQDYYLYNDVEVTGLIKEYNGRPEIILNSTSQIKIIKGEGSQDTSMPVVSWEDADKYYGKVVIVEGIVVVSNNTGKACFLNFHRNWKRYFTAVIFSSSFPKFPFAPEEHYLDKKVRIKGLVKEYQGKPKIVVDSPIQIEIVK